MAQLTYRQKLNTIRKILELENQKIPFKKSKIKKLRNRLLLGTDGNERIGGFVLVKSNIPKPYIQIYTNKSYRKAQWYLENIGGNRKKVVK